MFIAKQQQNNNKYENESRNIRWKTAEWGGRAAGRGSGLAAGEMQMELSVELKLNISIMP